MPVSRCRPGNGSLRGLSPVADMSTVSTVSTVNESTVPDMSTPGISAGI